MPEQLSTAASLSEILADLPARPRVHELAKRSGLSSRELIAALADRGIAVKAANSAVDPEAAAALLTDLLGAPPADPPEPPAGPGETATGEVPLFLEPDRPAKTRRAGKSGKTPEKAEKAENTENTDKPEKTESVEQTGRSRKSRTSSARKKPADEKKPGTATASTPDEPAEPAETGDQRGGRGATSTRRSKSSRTSEADTTSESSGTGAAARTSRKKSRTTTGERTDPSGASPDHDDAAVTGSGDGAGDGVADTAQGGDASADAADTESGSRRRRRRGRRGRGKSSDTSSDGSGDASSADDDGGSNDTDAGDDADRTDGDSHGGDSNGGDSNGGDSNGGDDPSDGESSSGSRRRRRRRRRGGGSSSGGDDKSRDDDPDNTVVHVRDGRSSASEVQGIKGSTRLEAKRQRRRDSRESRRRPQILTEAEFLARRESVDRVMVIRQRDDLAQVALLEDDVLVEHFVSRAGSASMIGNIYLGKVQNVLPSMEAAFVDIGRGRNAVLYAGEVNWDATGLQGKARRIETALNSGDTVLVQVSKDPVGHKGARLTTQISLPGRFLVYVPRGGATGISRKLPDTERKRLKKILDRIVPDDAGVIIRTAAEGVAEEELARDVERLSNQWETIRAAAEPQPGPRGGKPKPPQAPQQLSAEPDTLIKVIRDLFNSDIKQLVIDGDDAFASVSGYVAEVAPELADRVTDFSADKAGEDAFTRYRIDEQIAKALERKVHLPSGGSLVIDRTEAMTVVDVNTGKYTGSGGNLEETVTRNNLEAAEEVVRQLRLRDIGGIIVVDFIDMVLESNRDLVLRRLTECLGRDRTRHQVAEVTSLGLVQMTRKRMGTGLVEAFSTPCEHCNGRGLVLRDAPVEQTPSAGEQRSGRKRRDRKRSSEPAAEPIARIATLRADPRGPKPPLRPGAPVRSTAADANADTMAGADAQAADESVGAAEQVHGEVAEAVTAVTGAAEHAPSSSGSATGSDTAAGTADAATGDATTAPAVEEVPAARPRRRRRAASRPAGPAGIAEPVTVPADSATGAEVASGS